MKALNPEVLCRRCDPDQFTFETTAELEPLDEIIGQARAIEAVSFGIGIRREGYNLYVLGPHGIGKFTAVRQFLEQVSAEESRPSDWCYINNFEQPQKPVALQLPPGQGVVLRRRMEQLVEDLWAAIPAVFESDEYQARRHGIEDALKTQQEQAFEGLQQQAKAQNIALLRTPAGLAFAPMRDGHVLKPEEFEDLPDEEKRRLDEQLETLQERLQAALHMAQKWEKEARDKLKTLNREMTQFAAKPLIDELRAKYDGQDNVLAYLDAVEQDVVENTDEFRKAEEEAPPLDRNIPLPRSLLIPPAFRRYQVNVLVDHSETEGAPVVYEDYPIYQNLLGRVEHLISQSGAVTTDFTLIKAGALHRANNGYLILDAHKVLQQFLVWEQLKRVLRAQEIRIESLGQIYGLISTIALEPEPIPLNIKLVLIGDRWLYYLLCQLDPDFGELFKVAVDFEDDMDRNPESDLLYARLIGTLAKKEGLRHFNREAVARVIEHSSRMVSDAEKLSARMQAVADLLREADYWSKTNGRDIVDAADVQHAIEAQIYRNGRLRERIQKEIERGTILIDTSGEKVGQANGLSVISLGHFAFGRPNRITARVRLGKGEIVDIEREVQLGGPIHSKGVLILSSFLSARYVVDRPLSLKASLVFEQSYGEIEGDSASSAELYALLSALANVPIKQSLAVTGSVNQYGEVQAIGGVNEKIEGFFDLCQARGLTGEQGVLIPAANVKHLMLRADVVAAATEGKFHIYPVETIDQGIEILTGLSAGERDETGNFPENTINGQVEARLITLTETWRQFNQPSDNQETGS